jgi:hypothetical protein
MLPAEVDAEGSVVRNNVADRNEADTLGSRLRAAGCYLEPDESTFSFWLSDEPNVDEAEREREWEAACQADIQDRCSAADPQKGTEDV